MPGDVNGLARFRADPAKVRVSVRRYGHSKRQRSALETATPPLRRVPERLREARNGSAAPWRLRPVASGLELAGP